MLLASSTACGSTPLSGSVTVVGSSTLQPFMSAAAGQFVERHPRVDLEVEDPGTGQGLFLLCDGRAPIASASRRISPAERKLCRQNGVDWVALPVARDAIVVAT